MIVERKNKIFIFCFLIITLLVLSIVLLYDTDSKLIQVNYENINSLKQKLKLDNSISIDIDINGEELFYNKKEKAYYYYLDSKYHNTYVDLDINIYGNKKYKYMIINEKYDVDKGFFIDFYRPINIFVFNKDTYNIINVYLTALPILNIKTNRSISHEDTRARMELYSKNEDNTIETIVSDTVIRLRGASSSVYPKKSYKLTLRDKNKKNSLSLLGFEEDEDWVLDCMYSDFSKIRSKLAFDMWNELNSYTSNKVDNDVDMDYIDLYINDEYIGIYLLKEFVDNKLLSLDKTSLSNSGILIKGISNLVIDEEKYLKNKISEAVMPYEMKYPKNSDDYSKYWDNILNQFYFNNDNSYEYIKENFNIQNYIDYKLFIGIVSGTDNTMNKNIYISKQNMDSSSKILFTPWDLDMTFGYVWTSKKPFLIGRTDKPYVKYFPIDSECYEIKKEASIRYYEIRNTIFSEENIANKINTYYNKIRFSVKKDNNKWALSNLEEEVDYVKKMYNNKLEYLDSILVIE